MKENLMVFGFECGDGWYQLIYDLSVKVEDVAQKLKSQDIEESELPIVVQVKEKFGGLRFYMNHAPKELNDVINKTCEQSYEVCMQCAKPGSLRDEDYLITLCDSCYQNRG
jgi:hypothetical protein